MFLGTLMDHAISLLKSSFFVGKFSQSEIYKLTYLTTKLSKINKKTFLQYHFRMEEVQCMVCGERNKRSSAIRNGRGIFFRAISQKCIRFCNNILR